MKKAGALKGFLLTLVSSLLVLFFFYGNILKSPNEYYFASGGDGLKAYAGAVYHLEHDTSLYRMNAMNYPYGEMISFTGSQPIITNTIKRIDHWTGIDFSDSIIGIMNLLMLFSIVLGAVFLFLIFYELKCPWWYASLVGLGIAMLSPQIGRMGGHFSLSYVVWFPLMIWLLLKYDQKRHWALTLLIALVVYLSSGMHLYFLVFWGFLLGGYWFYRFTFEKNEYKKWYNWLQIFVQLILPFLILQLIIKYHDNVIDRTTYPWGFWAFRSELAPIFLPLTEPYFQFLKAKLHLPSFQWETYAFIGMVALVGVLIGIYKFINRIIKKESLLKVTDHKMLNILFWASVAALLFSFALPFSLGLKWLLNYLPPIRQIRALARFSWLFFYLINIVVFYGIFQYYIKNVKKRSVIILLTVAFLLFDGYLNITESNQYRLNKIPSLSDKENLTEDNRWIHNIHFEDYQAMLPLPYFHIGSESIWIVDNCGIAKQSLIVSMKTGLPSMGTMLSRTSLSQTYKSVQLITQPYRPYKILDDLPNQKPLLVLVPEHCNQLNPTEKSIIAKSDLLLIVGNFSYYKLTLDSLKTLPPIGKLSYQKEFSAIVQASQNDTSGYIYEDFNQQTSEHTLNGTGAFQGTFNQNNLIFETQFLGGVKKQKYAVRFWFKDYQKDLYARSQVIIQQKNDKGEVVHSIQEQLFRKFVRMDNDWIQVEVPILLKQDKPQISIFINNDYLKGNCFFVDELTIHPVDFKKEEEIQKIKNRILSDENWLNQVKQKATKRGISVDSMLTLDAIWVYNN